MNFRDSANGSKAHRRAKLILRTFISKDVNLLVHAFITYVRPLLEYNTVIWSPHTAIDSTSEMTYIVSSGALNSTHSLTRDIDAIECVQRRFTKCLRGYNQYTYSERLSRLKLQSLELRRLVTDLLWCYKIVFNVVDISTE